MKSRYFHLIGLALILSGIFHFGVFVVDGGPWAGPVSWRKPVTFGLSFGLTLISVAWVAGLVRMPERRRWVLLWVFAVDCVIEVAGITVQAWRSVPSHFNMETPVNTAVSMTLAVGGFVLIAVLITFAGYAFRGDPEQAPSMRLALRAGFATMLVALASGAAMIARGVVEVQSGHQSLAYQVGGFLKPLHGVAIHGVLVLPLVAWVAARLWPERIGYRLVAAAVTGYAAAMVGALVWSLW